MPSDDRAQEAIDRVRRELAEHERAAADARATLAALEAPQHPTGYRGGVPAAGDAAVEGPSLGAVLLLCQLPSALLFVAAVIEDVTRVVRIDDAALYTGAWGMVALMLISGAVGWALDRRWRRAHPGQSPSVLRTHWRLQGGMFVLWQLASVVAGLVIATFSLVHPRRDWGDGALGYLAFTGAYVVFVTLPMLVPAWLMARKGAALRVPRLPR